MKRVRVIIIAAAIASVVLLLLSFGVNTAYLSNGMKPAMAIAWNTADDGGSGMYYGFGCAFRVKVRLTPDSPKPTVIAYNAYILGIPVYRGIE